MKFESGNKIRPIGHVSACGFVKGAYSFVYIDFAPFFFPRGVLFKRPDIVPHRMPVHLANFLAMCMYTYDDFSAVEIVMNASERAKIQSRPTQLSDVSWNFSSSNCTQSTLDV